MCEHRTASKREMNPCRKPRVSSVHEGEWEKIKYSTLFFHQYIEENSLTHPIILSESSNQFSWRDPSMGHFDDFGLFW